MAKSKTVRPAGSLIQGILLSVFICLAGTLVLAWAMTAGILEEGNAFPILAALAGISAFAGAGTTVRRGPWGPLPSALAAAGGLALFLAAAGLLLWKNIAWFGHGGILLLCCLAGGILAGTLRRPVKTGRTRKRTW